MREYKFEITLSENDLAGDEFWELIQAKTTSEGIAELRDHLADGMMGNIFPPGDKDLALKSIKLKEFTNK